MDLSPRWLAGGRQRAAGVADREHSRLYQRAVLVRWEGERGRVALDLPGPIAGGGAVFKGMAVAEEQLALVCPCAVVRWAPGGAVEVSSHPWYNDLHGALSVAGQLLVADAGHDAVFEAADLPRLRRWLALPRDLGAQLDWRGGDLRPHARHPNFLARWQGETWVTEFQARSALSLDSGRRTPILPERCHDGVEAEGRLWFTTVDGRVWAVDPHGGVEAFDLRGLEPGTDPLGWCRGLLVDPDHLWVGFTRLRATRWRQNLAWLRGAWRGWQVATRRPTRLVRFRRRPLRWVASYDLEPLGLDAIFCLR